MKPSKRLLAVSVGVWAAVATGFAAAAEPTAELTPSEITLDEAAVLRVTADGGNSPALPGVDGLSFQRTGQSTEMTSINGTVSQHTSILYQVVAAHPGSYSIPIGASNLRLKVDPAGSRSPSGGAAFQAPQADTRPDTNTGSLAMLRVILPSRKLYVGQTAPITFKAYFRPGTEVTLTAAPSLGIPAFTIAQVSDQPRQSVESINGVPYRVATWTGQVSAAMPGHYQTSATLPIIARYREAVARPASDPFAGMLDDDSASSMLRSFMSRSQLGAGFDDLFGQVREREMTLHAPAQSIDALPLPLAGQPPSFSGAVGHFDVHATLAPAAGTTQEPMSLKIVIDGQGNFDRVSTTGLPSSASWKSYPPSATPTTGGPKIFEQAVVPQASGRVELPPVSFSFFDPSRREYVTRSTAPMMVQVAATVGAPAIPATAETGASAATSSVIQRPKDGRYVSTLLPPYRQRWFWPVISIPWIALAAGLALARRQSHLPSARARRRALRNAIARKRTEMRRAAVARDPVGFFEAARAAVQERLGERWGIAPDEVTAAEVESRIGDAGAPIIAALKTAEQLRYGGGTFDPGSLTDYDDALERQLDQLENRP